jgi:hypothetical protein
MLYREAVTPRSPGLLQPWERPQQNSTAMRLRRLVVDLLLIGLPETVTSVRHRQIGLLMHFENGQRGLKRR